MKEKINSIKNICSSLGIRVSTAESITGGRLQQQLTSISNSSSFFEGGVCAYSLQSKVNILNVPYELASKTNCVDKDVAISMAKGSLELFKSNISIATTGYVEEFEFEGERKMPVCYVSIMSSMFETVNIKYNEDFFDRKSRDSNLEKLSEQIVCELYLVLSQLG